MSETAVEPRENQGSGAAAEIARAVAEALDQGRDAEALAAVVVLHPADQADLIESISPDERDRLLELLRPELDPVVLAELAPDVQLEMLARLDAPDIARLLSGLESDDAVAIAAHLDETMRTAVLARMRPEDRVAIEQGLTYPDYTAGRRMQRDVVAVPEFRTVDATLTHLRRARDLPDEFYAIFVVDPRHRPIGTVPLHALLRSGPEVRLRDLARKAVEVIPATMDQEAAAFLFRQHDLVSAPVVDAQGRLVGVLTIDDMVDVLEEEREDDILKLGGVSEPDIYRTLVPTVRLRSHWLLINLATAIVASSVIALFQESIAQIVALAVLMPIVASMGGNAGTQTLTVAVRALATRELTAANALRIVLKEICVGAANGLVFALVGGIGAGLWAGSAAIGGVFGAAMVINLIAAGLAGAAIPLILERFGIDPAVGSVVILTTVTDVVGFFSFLGLAGWLLI